MWLNNRKSQEAGNYKIQNEEEWWIKKDELSGYDLELICSFFALWHLVFHSTLMLMRSVMSGMKTISSPSQLCLEFTSILPFSFHRWRPYRMKIWRRKKEENK